MLMCNSPDHQKEFYYYKNGKKVCKLCSKARAHDYYLKNKEKMTDRVIQWRKDHPQIWNLRNKIRKWSKKSDEQLIESLKNRVKQLHEFEDYMRKRGLL